MSARLNPLLLIRHSSVDPQHGPNCGVPAADPPSVNFLSISLDSSTPGSWGLRVAGTVGAMTAVVRLVLVAALSAVALAACGTDDDGSDAGEPVAAAGEEPVNKPQVCFEPEALVVLGGKRLGAVVAVAEGGPPVRSGELTQLVDGAFVPSLNQRLRELGASGDEAHETIAAAQEGLERVEAEPALLLDDDGLEEAFADAQAAAEDAELSAAGCGG